MIRDEALLMEGCVSAHNALAPLLALLRCSALLLKPLLAVHALLAPVRNILQDSFAAQEAGRRAAARALAALTLAAVQLARREGESGLLARLAGQVAAPLLSAYDPRVTIAGRAAGSGGYGSDWSVKLSSLALSL